MNNIRLFVLLFINVAALSSNCMAMQLEEKKRESIEKTEFDPRMHAKSLKIACYDGAIKCFANKVAIGDLVESDFPRFLENRIPLDLYTGLTLRLCLMGGGFLPKQRIDITKSVIHALVDVYKVDENSQEICALQHISKLFSIYFKEDGQTNKECVNFLNYRGPIYLEPTHESENMPGFEKTLISNMVKFNSIPLCRAWLNTNPKWLHLDTNKEFVLAEGVIALHKAARGRSAVIVEMLIKAAKKSNDIQVIVNKKNESGSSTFTKIVRSPRFEPLFDGKIKRDQLSIEKDQLKIMQLLIENGADLDIMYTDKKNRKHTLWMLAAINNQVAAANFLMNHCNLDVKQSSANNIQAIDHAANYGNFEMLTFLLAHGADINHVDEKGFSLLMWAANDQYYLNKVNENIKIIKYIIENCNNINARTLNRTSAIWSILNNKKFDLACKKEMIELLKEHNFSFSEEDVEDVETIENIDPELIRLIKDNIHKTL